RLRVPAEQQIAEERAQVEPDGSVEGEFRIDHSRIAFGHHHRARVEIPVNERLCFVEKLPSEARGSKLQLAVPPHVRNELIEVRRGVAVALAAAVRVTKDQVHRDAQQLLVTGEYRYSIHLLLERARQVRGEEARPSDVLTDVARDARVAPSANQALPEDDVGR